MTTTAVANQTATVPGKETKAVEPVKPVVANEVPPVTDKNTKAETPVNGTVDIAAIDALIANGDLNQALVKTQLAVAKNSKKANFRIKLGEIYFKKGEPDKAAQK